MTPWSLHAVGLASSLGLSSEEACAAARAGLVRVTAVDTLNTAIDPSLAKETLDGVPPVVAHHVPTLAGGHAGLGKLIALALPALDDLRQKHPLSGAQLSRTGLCLCLSDAFFLTRFGEAPEGLGDETPPSLAAAWQSITARLPGQLCEAAQWPIPQPLRWTIAGGRLGLLGALHQASCWLADGVIDRCLIGCIDSLIEPGVLSACATAGMVKTEANPVGFMPGEAAVFLLIEPTREGDPQAAVQIISSHHTIDRPYLDPEQSPMGRGLAKTVIDARAGQPGMTPLVIADLNGTELRALDWGHALVLWRDRLGEFESEVWLPVESFGETGAAHAGLSLCLAHEACHRGHARSGEALVVLCGEGGGRGALRLRLHATPLQ